MLSATTKHSPESGSFHNHKTLIHTHKTCHQSVHKPKELWFCTRKFCLLHFQIRNEFNAPISFVTLLQKVTPRYWTLVNGPQTCNLNRETERQAVYEIITNLPICVLLVTRRCSTTFGFRGVWSGKCFISKIINHEWKAPNGNRGSFS